MPIIDITMFEGRSDAMKEDLVREITLATVRAISVAPESVQVILRELPAKNFAVAGVPIKAP